MEDRDSFGWGRGRGGEETERRRDQGWRGRQTQPRALSGFLLPGSKPLHILADLQTAGALSLLPACLPATEVCATLPCRPLLGRTSPYTPGRSCSVCTGREAVLGGVGPETGCASPLGSIASCLEGRGPGLLATCCFSGAITV